MHFYNCCIFTKLFKANDRWRGSGTDLTLEGENAFSFLQYPFFAILEVLKIPLNYISDSYTHLIQNPFLRYAPVKGERIYPF